MSDTTISIKRKIKTAEDLHSVVNAMKTLAASSIGQYQKSVLAIEDYYRVIKLGLGECLRETAQTPPHEASKKSNKDAVITCIIFGSDQGLVGQFNESLSDFFLDKIKKLPGKHRALVVGERMHLRLANANIHSSALFAVPSSVKLIAPLIGELLSECPVNQADELNSSVYIFHNRPGVKNLYTPTCEKLLPLDASWQSDLKKADWPTKILPEIVGDYTKTLSALIREYLFILFFRACAESLASENASRLQAMERADENIQTIMKELQIHLNQMRQRSIDEELFDVIAGFESLS